MSWGKKQFKQAYNRAHNKSETNKKHIEDMGHSHYDIWAELQQEYYAAEMAASAKEIAIGRLLTLLAKLRVRYANHLLDGWYW